MVSSHIGLVSVGRSWILKQELDFEAGQEGLICLVSPGKQPDKPEHTIASAIAITIPNKTGRQARTYYCNSNIAIPLLYYNYIYQTRQAGKTGRPYYALLCCV